jgi:hypothetical protein
LAGPTVVHSAMGDREVEDWVVVIRQRPQHNSLNGHNSRRPNKVQWEGSCKCVGESTSSDDDWDSDDSSVAGDDEPQLRTPMQRWAMIGIRHELVAQGLSSDRTDQFTGATCPPKRRRHWPTALPPPSPTCYLEELSCCIINQPPPSPPPRAPSTAGSVIEAESEPDDSLIGRFLGERNSHEAMLVGLGRDELADPALDAFDLVEEEGRLRSLPGDVDFVRLSDQLQGAGLGQLESLLFHRRSGDVRRYVFLSLCPLFAGFFVLTSPQGHQFEHHLSQPAHAQAHFVPQSSPRQEGDATTGARYVTAGSSSCGPKAPGKVGAGGRCCCPRSTRRMKKGGLVFLHCGRLIPPFFGIFIFSVSLFPLGLVGVFFVSFFFLPFSLFPFLFLFGRLDGFSSLILDLGYTRLGQ